MSLDDCERQPFARGLSPTPVKCGRWAPRSSEVAFDSDGNLIFEMPSFNFFCFAFFFLRFSY